MIRSTMKSLVMAFLFGAAVSAPAGDIISIDVLSGYPYSTINGGKTYPNDATPHAIGETITIRMRLVNADAGGRASAYPWEFVSLSSSGTSWSLMAPKLGLSVGGVLRYAEMVSCLPTDVTTKGSEKYFTDIVFEYTVQPGDLAQPLRLMNDQYQEATGAESDKYLIVMPSANSHFYNAVDTSDALDTQRDAVFSFCSETTKSEVVGHYPPADTNEPGTPTMDTTLAGAGVYVKTVDFDSNYVDTASDPKVWRVIHENSATPTKNGNPSIVIDAAAVYTETGYATMWVWSGDESILVPQGETQVFTVNGVDRHALPVRLSTGDTQKSFVLRATGTEGQGTYVYMSSAPTNMYGTAGELVKNTVSRYVQVGEKMRPSVSVTFGGNSWTEKTATNGYMADDYATEMAITLSEPFTEDVTVTITPVLQNDGTNIDVYANHVIATAPSQGLGNGWQLATNTVTFTKDVDVEKFLYVYPLGATKKSARSGGTGIEFQITVEPSTADAHFVDKKTGVLYVNPAAPVVTDPVSAQVYAFTAGQLRTVEIAVDDSCRNMRYLDSAGDVVQNGTNFYTVVWERNDDTSTSEMKWSGLVPELSDGSMVLKLTDVKYPNSGTYLGSQITVTSPDGTKTVIPVSAEVSVPRTVTGTPDHEDLVYSEGETVRLTIGLSKRDGEELFAFVEPLNEDATNCLSGAQLIQPNGTTKNEGISVPGTGTAGIKTLDLTVLDGASEPKIQVVLCTTATYAKDKVVDRYTPQPITLLCENVAPKGLKLNVGGNGVSDGETMISVPADNAIQLSMQIDDVLADLKLDRDATSNGDLVRWTQGEDPDEFTNGLFITKWDFYNARGKKVDTRITVGTRNKQAVTNFTFTSIGTNTVVVQMLDKDMIDDLIAAGTKRNEIVSWEGGVPYGDENGYWQTSIVDDDWGPEFTIYVPVSDKAAVTIVPRNITVNADGEYGFDEGDAGTGHGFDVILSEPPAVPVQVKVTLVRTADTEGKSSVTDLGTFKLLNADGKSSTELAMDETASVTLSYKRGVDTAYVSIADMDGTPYSKYTLQAEVTTETKDDNGVKMKDYYNKGTYDFSVFNENPSLTSVKANVGITYNPSTGLTSTNAVTLSQNQEVTINWTVTDPVRVDRTNDFSVAWSSTEPGSGYETNNVTSGKYTTRFTTAGEKTITLAVTDKDGGANTYEWFFKVEASKRLYVYPIGPNKAALSTDVSLTYLNADGLGFGYTETDGAFGGSSKFRQTWDYSVQANTATIYARGFKSGAADNQTLVKKARDAYWDTAGADTQTAGVYKSPENKGRDSFTYAFINQSTDEASTFTSTLMSIQPQVGNDIGEQAVSLPLAEEDAVAYVDRYVQVIFSTEYLPSDNFGDINLDGIPDYFANKYNKGAGQTLVMLANGATEFAMGSDLISLAKFNYAEEYLPGVWQNRGEIALKANAGTSYAPIGHAFTAYRKIRGFHEGLNFTDSEHGAVSDVWFSPDETNAYKAAFLAANGTDWTDADGFKLSFWSPEPEGTFGRMDPTDADTDGDDFPDSWEYFFWYQAKVWANSLDDEGKPTTDYGTPRPGQKFLFEHFDFNNILRGTEIKSEDVLARFNPCTPIDTTAKDYSADFDGDGLSDYEELLIGTNPCHWDTDGDHICDGWEVMMGIDPLNGSKTSNADGDFMAYCSMGGYFAVTMPNGEIVFDVLGELKPYDELTDSGDYKYEPLGDPYYADKNTYDTTGGFSLTTDAQNEDGEDNYPLYQVTDDLTGLSEYTIDGTLPGVEPVSETVPVLVHDVTIRQALIAKPKMTTDADGNPVPYTYGLTMDEEISTDNPPFWHWGYEMLDIVADHTTANLTKDTVLQFLSQYILIHDQVHTAFGFDPRTGWYANADGYLADRWNPKVNEELNPFDSTGVAVNTSPYGDYDEYLVLKYRRDFGIAYAGDTEFKADDPWGTLAAYTTKPSVVYALTDIEALFSSTNSASTNATAGATVATNSSYTAAEQSDLTVTANIAEYLAAAFAQAGSKHAVKLGHGADTDGDGVPDGWELYKGRCPNAAPTDAEDGLGIPKMRDFDADTLNYASEYAGTDSCNAYRNCASIYANHPGLKSGWYNKFFPTDPDDADTDGDFIVDGGEGAAWAGVWPNGGVSYQLGELTPGFTFIYGNPQDSITTCVRGGGMNPCTVDTDKDGLPDLWEMQHAGIPVDAGTRQYVPPPELEEDVEVIIADATFTADGLDDPTVTVPSNVVYIAGGMDATWLGDAYTDPSVADQKSFDEQLGTVRDVDFDHDGLQNYQEYFVQQIRHFRFDDGTTPLMGRMADDTFYGFVTMQQNAASFVQACADAGYPASVTDAFTADAWVALGYFGTPKHSWDMMICCLTINPYIMLPPNKTAACNASALGTYISTDPRLSDTDVDGMDDYYELFHGLNPLLGTTTPMPTVGPQDIIWNAYGQPSMPPADYPRAHKNAWTKYQAVETKDCADPILYPWMMGALELDPDGDGLRNDSERLTANLTSPENSHTDPTPLWFTDTSSVNSYVTQYYVLTAPASGMPFWPMEPIFDDPYSVAAPLGGNAGPGYCFAFEENEGYDTDNDWTGDGREMVKTLRAPTDPLDFTDPRRRQALYLDGNRSWVMSRETNYRGIDAVDFFKQFTVEAWVRPEKTAEQTILDRTCAYGYDAISKDESAIRSNFRIGLTDAGNVYGMFDNNDAIESGRREGVSCQTVTGPVLELDTWTHVALTYDGKRLVLYVNGLERASAATTLIPANGVMNITQDPSYTNAFVSASYQIVPSAFFIGGRPVSANDGGALALSAATTAYGLMRADEWYQGYVDEVRVWDGVRTETEIAENYRKHMTLDDAATNRLEVYTHLMGPDADASRNDNDGLKTLTAELVQLYDFSTLPSAANAGDVAKVSSGFSAVADQLVSKPAAFDQNVGWWNRCATKSTVYTDYTVVPWIENTVHHLPVMDGSVVDSFLYSTYLGGYYTQASAHGLTHYTFRNSAMPYQYYDYYLDRYQRLFSLNQVSLAYPDDEKIADILTRYQFEIRSDFVGTADLLPMGGAFAKICPAMWDGQGVADAWEQTGTDTDGDGLPDWWEDANGLDKTDAEDWAKTMKYPDANGVSVPAWEAYLRDLARGLQPDGSYREDYVPTADGDGDGLLDWWQNLYAVTGAGNDDDGDGLSNYVEYMLTEVFHLKDDDGTWLRFAPDNPYSVNALVSDYFYRINQLYVGEVFADHDRVKDLWEADYLAKSDDVSPYAYDGDYDADADGWSNYAEFQAGTDPTVLGSLSVDGIQMDQYPVPTIELQLAYHGNQNIGDMPVVVKAWSDQTLTTIPDAVWTLGGEGDVTEYEGGGSNVVTGVKYFGMNPMKQMLLHLSPGSVVPGSVKFEFKDLSWILYDETAQQAYLSEPATAIWYGFIIDRARTDDLTKGDVILQGSDEVYGTIDYATGTMTVDFTKMPETMTIVGDVSGANTGDNWNSIYTLATSYVRVNWQSKLITGGNVNTYYLAEADDRSTDNNSLGHVKEGLNTLVAFYDFDGDGMYTPGEPFGFARDVDVGWNYGRAMIELTDTTPVTARYTLTKGGEDSSSSGTGTTGGSEATDREQLYPGDASDVVSLDDGASAPEKDHVRVRIVRYAVDSMSSGTLKSGSMAVVFDRNLDLTADGHPTITEADILNMVGNEFDLDWNASAISSTQTDLSDVYASLKGKSLGDAGVAQFTNVFYTVYTGNGAIQSGSTTVSNILGKVIVRKFGLTRAAPVPVLGSTVINTAAPTFSWRNDDTTFTAFKVRVTSDDGFSWTSDYQLMPPRGADGVCSWTAPLRAGAIVPGGTAEFTNGGTYKWEVSTYNAKYKTDSWVTGNTFLLNVITNALDYGTVHVAVRYYGPDTVASSGTIRVQAFSTPDFTGEPVGEGYVSSLDDLASKGAVKTANATIIGLKEGSYYIRAFVDTDGDGQLSTWTDNADRTSKWESWGCYCTRDVRLGTIFTPKSVTVGPKLSANELISVWIDDCDSDQDSMPDAWEWFSTKGTKTSGNLTTYGAKQIDQKLTGGFTMKKSLVDEITSDGQTASGLAVLTTKNLRTPRVAALLLGLDATGSDDEINETLAGAADGATAEPTSVVITSIALDPETRQVTIAAQSQGETSGSAAALSGIYVFSSDEALSLTCKVWHRERLDSGDWSSEPVATKKVSIGSETNDYTFELGDDIDLTSGFFKVTLEK